MKKSFILSIILLLYIIFYRIYLSYKGELMIYIINPIIWIITAITFHILLSSKKRKTIRHNVDVLSTTIIITLIYIIIYYLLGMATGYTNNPYSTTISGIVINLFSIWLVICLKEYVRYILINVRLEHYKKVYYVLLFFIFFLADINFSSIISTTNLIDLWSKELIIPMMLNLLMMYLSYVSDYKSAIISRSILILPSLIFNILPDYKWFIIMAFNIVYPLSIYLIVQYAIGRSRRDLPIRLIGLLNPRKWITTLIVVLLTMAFAAGFFPLVPTVILSGSMETLISPGDLVIIKKCDIDNVKVGDIVEYKMDDYNIVHRVIAVYSIYGKKVLITKGDANKKSDINPVTSDQLVGKLEYNLPYLGYPSYLLKNIVHNNKEVVIEKGEKK